MPITIAVIELVGGDALVHSINALRGISGAENIEIKVFLKGAAAGVINKDEFPDIEMVENSGETIPLRRASAFRQSKGDVVGLIEDTVVLAPSWIDGARDLFSDSSVVAASGSLNIGPNLPARYRALAALEYGQFLQQPGPTCRNEIQRLPGCNMAFRRSYALTFLATTDRGMFEHQLLDDLRARKQRIVFDDRLSAIYFACDKYGAKFLTRMRHGRLFAGGAARRETAPMRLFKALRSIFVPVVLTIRGIGHLLRGREGRTSLIDFAWIFVMSVFWGLGEFLGYSLGEGDSLESWT